MIYGYARVSTQEQKEDRQLDALCAAGIPQRNVYVDKRSGKDFERPQYKKLLQKLKKDDLLYIKSIDRLGRNYMEIQEQWRRLTKSKGVDIVVIDMPLLDTRRGKDLMGTFLSDIGQRQAEGIAAAKARGIRFGRPPKALPSEFNTVLHRWKAGEVTGKDAAALCGMPLSSFLHRAKRAVLAGDIA